MASTPPYITIQHDPPPSYDEVMYGLPPPPATTPVTPLQTPSPLLDRQDVFLCSSPSTAVQDAARYTATVTQGGNISPTIYCSEDGYMRYPDDILISQHVVNVTHQRCRSSAGQTSSPVLTKLLIIGGVLTVLMVSAAIVVSIVTRDPYPEKIISKTFQSSSTDDLDWDYLNTMKSTPAP